MKPYIKILIFILILLALLCIVFMGVMLQIEGAFDDISWGISSVFICSIISFIHIIAEVIYGESKNKKSKIKISGGYIALVFLISMIIQIIGTIYICFEAWKRFGNIHPIEYFAVSIFLLLSVYFFRNASYKLIDKENNNGKDKTK